MPTFAGTAAFVDADARLCALQDRDFERGVLTYLRPLWPALQESVRMRGWDRRGVDLFLEAGDGTLAVAVQCKGFLVGSSDEARLAQIEQSIAKFQESGAFAELFIVALNQPTVRGAFLIELEALLTALRDSGRAGSTQVLSTRRLLDGCCESLVQRIQERLKEHNELRRTRYTDLFQIPVPHLPEVPLELSLWHLRQARPAGVEAKGAGFANVSDLLADTGSRWTLLTGVAGAGKTTTALNAGGAAGPVPIVVACRELPDRAFDYGTTLVIDSVLQELDVLSDVAPGDQAVLYRLASASFTKLLRSDESRQWLLVLDGLDEHRKLSATGGLARLSNQLAELRCPIVLTTRTEHLRAMTGDLQAALTAATGTDWRRPARHLELLPWKVESVIQYISQLAATLTGRPRERVEELRALATAGKHAATYGDLLSNPLYLRLVVEDVAAGGVRASNRTQLLERAFRGKVWRDRDPAARAALGPWDQFELVGRCERLMEDVAWEMTDQTGTSFQLVETVDEVRLLQLARTAFDLNEVTLLPVLLHSALMPVSLRSWTRQHVGFALRVFHEFFLARRLVALNDDGRRWPDPVAELVTELRQG